MWLSHPHPRLLPTHSAPPRGPHSGPMAGSRPTRAWPLSRDLWVSGPSLPQLAAPHRLLSPWGGPAEPRGKAGAGKEAQGGRDSLLTASPPHLCSWDLQPPPDAATLPPAPSTVLGRAAPVRGLRVAVLGGRAWRRLPRLPQAFLAHDICPWGLPGHGWLLISAPLDARPEMTLQQQGVTAPPRASCFAGFLWQDSAWGQVCCGNCLHRKVWKFLPGNSPSCAS